MPRPLRIHVPNGFYHATLRGNHQQAIFRQESERQLLNGIVARSLEKYRARLHAYCWMTNHLHLIVQVGEQPLGKVMQQIASQYARAFQLNLRTTGHLFENRYFATLIDTDAYLLEALRYVHQNPLRAGMVSCISEHPWSSHFAYLSGNQDVFVTTDFALAMLSPDRGRAVIRYKAFVDEAPAAEMAAELAALDEGSLVLGDGTFMARHAGQPSPPSELEALIARACRQLGVTLAELRSSQRTAPLVAARAFVARQATDRGISTLAAVARALNRDEASLRSAMRNHDPQQNSQFSLPDTTIPASRP